MSDCLFCKIAAGEIPAAVVYEDDLVLAFKDINPRASVHLLTIPKQHVASLAEIDDQHHDLIAHMMKVQNTLAEAHGLESGFRNIINTGRGGGQEVFHLHIHLLGGANLPKFTRE